MIIGLNSRKTSRAFLLMFTFNSCSPGSNTIKQFKMNHVNLA